MGELSNTASDIVGGLRVLRGIGGEEVFHDRYRRESQATRRAGVQVARLQSVLDALQVFLPGVFVVARGLARGAGTPSQGRISPGELVAFYGYSAFLMIPLRTATEYANKLIRGRVAARRRDQGAGARRPTTSTRRTRPTPPPAGAELADARTGLRISPGLMTALVSDQPDEAAALADRLGLCAPEVRRRRDPGRRTAHERCAAPTYAAGSWSPTPAPPCSRAASRRCSTPASGDVSRALATASTDDILEALPDGLDTVVAERGRTFSGGQRQRLVLARALAGDPEILVLVEPTSAVDAHTEARIASRLRGHREGRTTVVVTSSPLVLDAVDEVAFLRDGRVVATGAHRDLLENDAGYRAVVTRESRAGRGRP